MEGGERPGKCL